MTTTPRTRAERDQFAAGQRWAHSQLDAWRDQSGPRTVLATGRVYTIGEVVTNICAELERSQMFTLGAKDVACRWWRES